MKTKIQKAVLGGIVGTAAMTLVIFMAPMMGMPKMNPAAMLSDMLGIPILLGWMMHFMIGIFFALSYTFILSALLKKIPGKIFKGLFFGLLVFIFAQIMITILAQIMGNPMPMGDRTLMLVGSLMGHIIYGVVTILGQLYFKVTDR